MIFLKVLVVVLGLAFLLFGYFIYFKKKYNLINGFEIVLLITGVALILFA